MVDTAAARPVAAAATPQPESAPDLDAAVTALLTGDEAAFCQVYRAVQPGLLRYLGVLVGHCDAEDVASETWAQAVRDRARFRGDFAGFRAWVTTIGRHRALDHLRRAGRRPMADTGFGAPDRPDPGDTERDALERLSTRAALARISALPIEQAEAILLRVVVGLDAKQAARVLGRRPGAVRTAAYRGLRALHEQVAARVPGDIFDGPDAEVVR